MDAKVAPLSLRLEIPLAPLAIRTAEAREFQAAIKTELELQGWRKWHAGGVTFPGAVEMELMLYYYTPASWSERKKARTLFRTVAPEASDLAKLVLEAMTGICYKHPAQVARLMVEKRYGPACTVIILRSLGA